MVPETDGQDYPVVDAVSTDPWGSETTQEVQGESKGKLENQDGEIQDEEGVETVEVQDGKSQDKEEVEEVEVPASQPRGDDEEEEKPPVDPPHHILDEFQRMILLRAEQDAAMGVAGKGRKKKAKTEKETEQVAKTKGKRGEAKVVPSATSAAPKKRTRKPKGSDGETAPKKPRTAKASRTKDPVARRLFHDDSPEKQSPPTKPNPKKKASPKKKAPPKKTEKAKTGEKEEKKVKRGKVIEEKAEKGQVARVPREKKHKVPSFSCSHVVPYWSRDAVALKVPGGGGKTGLTQAGLNTS